MTTCQTLPTNAQNTLLTFTDGILAKFAHPYAETFSKDQESDTPSIAAQENTRMPITTISVNGKQRMLSTPLLLKIHREDTSTYIAQNDALNIAAIGDSPEAAIKEATSDVAAEYLFYTAKSDSELIGLARKLKQTYSALFCD